MAETITMPKLGFDMAEGTLVRWVRNEGEYINKGDVLAEIETDKATVEVESSASGVVRKLLVDQGAVVPIGAAIAIVGGKDEKIEVAASAEVTPSKPALSAPEPAATTPTANRQPSTSRSTPEAINRPPSTVSQQSSMLRASPLAKKMARDEKIDLSGLRGTGPGGRIVRKDIETALAGGQPSGVSGMGRQKPLAIPVPSVMPVAHEDELVTPTKLRQAIARRMAESKKTIPHFYVAHEYKMDALIGLRKQLNEFLPDDQKISVNDFVIRATALTLREFPNLNSSLQGDQLLRHGSVSIGVAVAVEGGLLTVVCKDTDQKPLRQISVEVKAMAGRARDGKVKPDDIEGSTFSVSNLGMFDVENFLAIINPPEAGILAVGSAREVPVVEGSEVKAGWRMKATVAVDHRISDGAEAAQFMQALAKYLEEPVRLLI